MSCSWKWVVLWSLWAARLVRQPRRHCAYPGDCCAAQWRTTARTGTTSLYPTPPSPGNTGFSWKWVVLWSLWAARLVRQPTQPLRVSGGLLRGSVAHDGSHRNYLAIPYATVTREHRFQAPGPEPTWEGVFEAIEENVHCLQERLGVLNIVTGQENCLTLNVYTPIDSTLDAQLPVMVIIHGGANLEGSNAKFMYGPNYLVSKKVILVSINYRLNMQGFLCLGIKEVPGNAAMKDQVAALKWVRKNIKAFGGDPENVTIFGISSGAGSVSYHVISPMSKGLFHKAITQSGSSIATWALQYKSVYIASLLAKALGYSTEDPHELHSIFMNKTDAELITTTVPREDGNIFLSQALFVPCVEKIIDGVEPFLTEAPFNVLEKGDYNKVPMIIGSNNEEGIYFVSLEDDTQLSRIRFHKSLPRNMDIPFEEERKEIGDKLKNMYMGQDEISAETRLKLSRFYGEVYFNYPAFEETELILRTSDKPVFNYLFSYRGWRNFQKVRSGISFIGTPGATHADELFYLFKLHTLPTFFEGKMIDKMTTMWTNFAKYGDPTPVVSELLPVKWQRTDRKAPRALVIDAEFSTAPLWFSETVLYWKQLYAKYRRRKY